MTVYLDASAIVPLFVQDIFSEQSMAILRGISLMQVSDFASAEFVSAIGIRFRRKDLTLEQAQAAIADFDSWKQRRTLPIETQTQDIRLAETVLRRLTLGLRTPDALHIAIAQRLKSSLVTFDKKMAAAAQALGLRLHPVNADL